MTEPRQPKQAATVILLRRAEPKGFEVFLTRRPDGMPFLGGMYCYPGGTVNEADCRAALIARTVGRTPREARQIIGAAFTPEKAMGVWIAAVREVFEEVGVLLAAEARGGKMAMGPDRAARLVQSHEELSKKTLNFAALLEREQLYCDLASLSHFSTWQTPAQFTNMSIRPSRDTMKSAAASTVALDVRSTGVVAASANEADSRFRCNTLSFSALRAEAMTRASDCTSASAMARPIVPVAPTTQATSGG